MARVRHSAYDLVIDGSCPDQSRKGDPDHTACVESIVGSTMHSVILCHSFVGYLHMCDCLARVNLTFSPFTFCRHSLISH